MNSLTLWLWTFNPKTVPLLGYPKVIPYKSLKTLGSFVFELCRGQTDRQTDRLKNPTHADRHMLVGVGRLLRFTDNEFPWKNPSCSSTVSKQIGTTGFLRDGSYVNITQIRTLYSWKCLMADVGQGEAQVGQTVGCDCSIHSTHNSLRSSDTSHHCDSDSDSDSD